MLSVVPYELDLAGGGRDAAGGKLTALGERVHGLDPRDGCRHERQVVAGAEPDLHHLAVQWCAHPLPDQARLLVVHQDVHDARKDLVSVEAHEGSMTLCYDPQKG